MDAQRNRALLVSAERTAAEIRALPVPEPAPAAPSIGSDMQAAIVCPRCGIQNWDPRAAGVHARWCDSLGSAPAATGAPHAGEKEDGT